MSSANGSAIVLKSHGKHYLQTTDEHFERAIQGGAKSGAHVAEKASQHSHAVDRMVSQTGSEDGTKPREKEPVLLNETKRCVIVQKQEAEMHGNRTHRTQG